MRDYVLVMGQAVNVGEGYRCLSLRKKKTGLCDCQMNQSDFVIEVK